MRLLPVTLTAVICILVLQYSVKKQLSATIVNRGINEEQQAAR